MALPEELQQDMQEAKVERSIRQIKFVDGKLVSHYEIRETVNGETNWTEYEKIFDTWEQFVAYSQAFFNLQ